MIPLRVGQFPLKTYKLLDYIYNKNIQNNRLGRLKHTKLYWVNHTNILYIR